MTPHRATHRDTAVSLQVRGGGVEPPSPGSRPGSLPLADPRSRSRAPCGNRTRFASLEGWRLCRSAKGTCVVKAEGEGVEPSRLIARPLSGRLPSPVGLPFRKAAVAGIEPATRRLTGARPYQHRPHRNRSQDGGIWTRDLVLPKHAEYQAFLRPACEPGTNHAPGRRRVTTTDEPIRSGLRRAPSGSRTRTFAMARRQAAATSWAQNGVPNCQ